MIRQARYCRLCGGSQLEPLLSLGCQQLTGVFPRTAVQTVTSGPLELVKCHAEGGCGLVQLLHSYDCNEIYGDNYGYRSGLNKSMVAHLRATVDGLLQRTRLSADDIVLDIGSNDGTLLACYPKELARIGMDPSAAKFRKYYEPDIDVLTEFFSAESFRRRFGGRKAKLITSIAMFYDLESPRAFVEELEAILDNEGLWHFEQSYMPAMLAANAYDTICHEHLEYYGLTQIKWLIDRCGLRIVDVKRNEINGGSFAVTVAKAASAFPANESAIGRMLEDEARAGLATLAPYREFAGRVFAHRDELRARIDAIVRQGATVLGYGASTKGNVILQFCGLSSAQIPCIAEVNSDKFGCFTPGTRIPIISEQQAHAMRPDYLLVLPWHFRQNLIARESAFLDRGGRMIFPLPKIEIVSR